MLNFFFIQSQTFDKEMLKIVYCNISTMCYEPLYPSPGIFFMFIERKKKVIKQIHSYLYLI